MRRRIIRHRKQSRPALHMCRGMSLGGGLCWLSIEPNPLRSVLGHELVVERCGACGDVLDVRGVLPTPELVNNDDDDPETYGV